jgi:hypothetical protein
MKFGLFEAFLMNGTRFRASWRWSVVGAIALLSVDSALAADGHPLDPAIAFAKKSLAEMEDIRDYSARFIKRERIDGKLGDYEYARIKVRHEPFSVYMGFYKPDSVEGREAILINGKLFGHEPAYDRIGTFELDPNSALAMKGQRYPITDMGVKNLAMKLIERGEQQKQKGVACDVKIRDGARINGRPVTLIEVVATERRVGDEFRRVRVYIDPELHIPIRYEAHDWPATEGGELQLLEEYTYLDVKVNQGFTDRDFDINNREYSFPDISVLSDPLKSLFGGGD